MNTFQNPACASDLDTCTQANLLQSRNRVSKGLNHVESTHFAKPAAVSKRISHELQSFGASSPTTTQKSCATMQISQPRRKKAAPPYRSASHDAKKLRQPGRSASHDAKKLRQPCSSTPGKAAKRSFSSFRFHIGLNRFRTSRNRARIGLNHAEHTHFVKPAAVSGRISHGSQSFGASSPTTTQKSNANHADQPATTQISCASQAVQRPANQRSAPFRHFRFALAEIALRKLISLGQSFQSEFLTERKASAQVRRPRRKKLRQPCRSATNRNAATGKLCLNGQRWTRFGHSHSEKPSEKMKNLLPQTKSKNEGQPRVERGTSGTVSNRSAPSGAFTKGVNEGGSAKR